jgi:hypothetical protein
MVILKVRELKSWREKIVGLIGKKKPESVFIRTRFGIHTFFLKFPIDVMILDSKNKVVDSKTIKPNRTFFWNPIYDKVLELPEGTIEEKKIKNGNEIKIT